MYFQLCRIVLKKQVHNWFLRISVYIKKLFLNTGFSLTNCLQVPKKCFKKRNEENVKTVFTSNLRHESRDASSNHENHEMHEPRDASSCDLHF